MLKIFLIFFIFFTQLLGDSKPKLLFYCGITMIKPMKEIVKIIEQKYNCKIVILEGGSKDLYDSLKYSKKGDLYLPGSYSYIKEYLKEGFLLQGRDIGFNQAAIFVQKNNPKKIKGLAEFLREDIATSLCEPQSGSIGKISEIILKNYKGKKFLDKAYHQVGHMGTDSRSLNRILIEKTADMTINWKATAYWDENKKYIDIIPIDEKYAPKDKLVLSLLKSSKHPKIAKMLIEFTASKEGRKIMKKYGFL